MSDETSLSLSAEKRTEIDRIKRELDLSDSVTAVEYGIACRRRFDRMTNKMVQRNAELLRRSAVQTAAEGRRSGTDSEALSMANGELIRAIEETMRLDQESKSRSRRAEAEPESIDQQLKMRCRRWIDYKLPSQITALRTSRSHLRYSHGTRQLFRNPFPCNSTQHGRNRICRTQRGYHRTNAAGHRRLPCR